MKYNLKNEIESEQFNEKVKYLLNKQKHVELKEIRKKRSLNQNAYLHLIFTFIGSEIGYTMEETKHIFKLKYLSYEKNNYKFAGHTSKLNTKEMTIFIEQIRNYSSIELGIYVPSPDEKNKLDWLQEQMQQFKIYQ